jgi:DNA-binding NarL/FixJ family response regulator
VIDTAPKFRKILIVDDDWAIRDSIKCLLSLKGFIPIEASDGQSAMAAFKKERPDAVLLDLNMPGMPGLEVLTAMRNMDNSVPVIILTGFDDTHVSLKAGRFGAYEFETKPPDFEKLINIINHALEDKKNTNKPKLSLKEIEVLRLSSNGNSVWQISDILNISENTVNYHLKRIKERLNAKNIAHAVAIAIEKGLICRSDDQGK